MPRDPLRFLLTSLGRWRQEPRQKLCDRILSLESLLALRLFAHQPQQVYHLSLKPLRLRFAAGLLWV